MSTSIELKSLPAALNTNPFTDPPSAPPLLSSSSTFSKALYASQSSPPRASASSHPPLIDDTPLPPSFSSSDYPHPSQQLHPVDRGINAILYVSASCLVETIVWGLPFSVGILHSYWTTTLFADAETGHVPEGGESLLTLAATLQGGLMYLWCVVCGPTFNRFPYHRVHLQLFGLLCGFLGIFGSAFATEPWHILLTLGLIYPVVCFFYFPAPVLLFEWFSERRGIASGILYAGTGVGGCVFPFIMQGLLSRFSYKASMIALSLGFLILNGIALPFIKRRIPLPRKGTQTASHRSRPFNSAFLKRSTFYAFFGAILFTSLGNFIPSVWLPTYTQDIEMYKPTGTALISIMNASSVPGLLLMGYLSDHIPLRIVITVSALGSALSCLFLWGFASHSGGLLVAFAITFGLLALSFTAIWAKLISVISKDDPTIATLIFSLFAFARGIGNISSGPAASALLKSDAFRGAVGSFGVKNYGALLIYSGITMLFGSIVGVSYRDN